MSKISWLFGTPLNTRGSLNCISMFDLWTLFIPSFCISMRLFVLSSISTELLRKIRSFEAILSILKKCWGLLSYSMPSTPILYRVIFLLVFFELLSSICCLETIMDAFLSFCKATKADWILISDWNGVPCLRSPSGSSSTSYTWTLMS